MTPPQSSWLGRLCVPLVVCLLHVPAGARAGSFEDPEPTTPPATSAAAAGDFEVREWIILVCDPHQPHANAAPLVTTTFPAFIESRRQRTPTTRRAQPCPVGIIRIIGSSEQKIDVKLEVPSGRILANWPNGHSRSTSVLWRDLSLGAEPQRPAPLEADQWMRALREGGSAWLREEARCERFLLYDVEVPYALPLKLSGGRERDEPLQAANVGETALHDLALYRAEAEVWRSASLDLLPPGRKLDPATAPATAPSTAPSTQPTTTQPATAPAAQLPVQPQDIREMRLTQLPTTQPADVVADWKQRLAPFELEDGDLELVIQILRLHACDANRLTAVYRLDPTEIERLLPLEVIPQPKRVTRLALVIAKNIDPSIPHEIERLVAQLGHPDWRTREQASHTLAEIGPAAKAQLESARKSPDQEIVLRAERLLAQLEEK